ncbi:MAG: CBS domain-containing protein [Vicingaceae bacterium]
MIASELISYDIPPLKLTDKGNKALDWMEEFKTTVLPVVKEGAYAGLISESNLLDSEDLDQSIETFGIQFIKPNVNENQHLFEVITTMVENDIDVLPVVNNSNKYLGVITNKMVVESLSKVVSVSNAGSIITLEVNIKDYSLSEIARMVESDDAKVLASFLTSHPDSTKLEVTLKINKTDISRILHTFERFNYVVLASYNESEYHQNLQNKYDEFMRFLNT